MENQNKNLLMHFAPSNTSFELDRPAENRKKFTKLIQWICINIDNQITIDDMIKKSGLTFFELSMQFKYNYKLSPLHFIEALRQHNTRLELAGRPAVDNTYILFDPKKI